MTAPRPVRLGLAAAAIAALLGFGVSAWWRASRELAASREAVARESELAVSIRRLDPAPPAGAEPFRAPAAFTDAASFQGRLYLCGPAGLFAYSPEGVLEAEYRPGLELPAAPLTRMAVGVAGAAGQPALFIATLGEGLLEFDGQGFTHVRPAEAGLRKLTAIVALPTGRLLLGAEKRGVLVWDGRSLGPFHPSLRDMPVTALAGNDTEVWAGTLDRGVVRWRAGEVQVFGEGAGVPDAHILSLAADAARQAVYAGTGLGVAEFRDGKPHRTLGEGLLARSLLAREGALLVGTLEEGVVEIPLETRRPRGRVSGRPGLAGAVERLVEIGGGPYALLPDGLYAASGGWRKVLGADEALLADRNIAALAASPDGRLWIGYFDRGLDIAPAGGGPPRHVENEHVFCVNRIVPRAGGAVVATANGLALFDAAGTPRRVLTREDGLIANHATDVLVDGAGMVVATPAGLTFLDPAGARSLYAFHGLVNNHVYALASSGRRLLAGTLGGISVLEDGVVRASYTTANSGLRHNWITAIVPVDGEWFAGTYGAGIFRLEAGGLWRRFADLPAEFEVNPNAMTATALGVYAGTLDRGLAVYHRAGGRWTFTTAGLPSHNVTALAAHGGKLYVGTDNGLVRIEERSLVTP